MEINIGVFNILEAIAKNHFIRDAKWADAAQIRRPTISEMRRISRTTRKKSKDTGIKRLCTLQNMMLLCNGLRTLVGSTTVNEALKNGISVEPDQTIRLQLLILMLKDAEPGIKDEAEAMLKRVLGSIEH